MADKTAGGVTVGVDDITTNNATDAIACPSSVGILADERVRIDVRRILAAEAEVRFTSTRL